MKRGIFFGSVAFAVLGGAALFMAGFFEREISTEVRVEAPPDRVWDELSDFESYAEWNPFIPKAEGEITEGAEIEVRIEPPESDAMTFRPRILTAEPNRELRWLGRVFVPGIFDGEHYFLIESTDDGTLLTQGEKFNGVLVPFLWKSLDTNTRRGFEEMNHSLKDRIEEIEAGRN